MVAGQHSSVLSCLASSRGKLADLGVMVCMKGCYGLDSSKMGGFYMPRARQICITYHHTLLPPWGLEAADERFLALNVVTDQYYPENQLPI